MIPKTPQKKNSLELEHRDSINNSCKQPVNTVIWNNHSNIQPQLERSIFKARGD